ncbi:hypothetical protein D3C81_1673060 [compost metagenome]
MQLFPEGGIRLDGFQGIFQHLRDRIDQKRCLLLVVAVQLPIKFIEQIMQVMRIQLRLNGLQLRFPLADLGQIYLIDQLAHLLRHTVEAVADITQLISGVHPHTDGEITGTQRSKPLHQMCQRSQESPGGYGNQQRTEQDHADSRRCKDLDYVLVFPLNLQQGCPAV